MNNENEMLKLRDMVIRIDTNVESIKSDVSELSVDTKKSREIIYNLGSRIGVLEKKPDPFHECIETERQIDQDVDISKIKEKIIGNSKITWWLLGVFVVVFGTSVSYAIVYGGEMARNSTMISENARDISGNQKKINDLEKSRQEDAILIIREIHKIPNIIDLAIKSINNNGYNEDDLTQKERRYIDSIIRNAELRASRIERSKKNDK